MLSDNINKLDDDGIVITLLSIFDKGEMENVSDSYIKSIVKDARKK